MLKYQLICVNDHEFEGWFSNSSAFSEQVANGYVDCPICGAQDVRRALMAPNLNSPKQRKSQLEADKPEGDIATKPEPAAEMSGVPADRAVADPLAKLSAKDQEAVMGAAMSALRQMHKKVKADFTNVGDKFADEARKIHYGDAEKKPIYGTTTPDEREELSDEGVAFHELPDLPPEH